MIEKVTLVEAFQRVPEFLSPLIFAERNDTLNTGNVIDERTKEAKWTLI